MIVKMLLCYFIIFGSQGFLFRTFVRSGADQTPVASEDDRVSINCYFKLFEIKKNDPGTKNSLY